MTLNTATGDISLNTYLRDRECISQTYEWLIKPWVEFYDTGTLPGPG